MLLHCTSRNLESPPARKDVDEGLVIGLSMANTGQAWWALHTGFALLPHFLFLAKKKKKTVAFLKLAPKVYSLIWPLTHF